MSDTPKPGVPPAKKSYVKPQVKRVPLKPEEAVLGACKMAGTSGPVQAQCTVPANCNAAGS